MKLFGGKRKEPREKKSKTSGGAAHRDGTGAARKRRGWHRLSGVQRGLILLALSVTVLVGTAIAVSKALIRPPELKPSVSAQAPAVSNGADGPASSEAVQDQPRPIRYQSEDGNETEFQFERPGSPQEGFYNILLVGVDNDRTRTDTIIIARLDANEHTVAMMSIPRDTLINGGYAVPKLNSVYGANGKGEQGVAALRQQLESILGFEVNGYALVDLEAFVELVDLVGGVEFYVPQRMYYSDPTQDLYIDLNEGEQLLDGQHAMQLVRFRKYAEADIKRTQVQQDFLKALAKKCLSLGNLPKLQSMVEIAMEHVETDLTLGNLLYFIQELMDCDLDNMASFTLPGQGVWIGGGSYYALYANQVQQIVNENFNPYDADIPLSSFHIRGGASSSAPVQPNPNTQTPSRTPKPSTTPKPPIQEPERMPEEPAEDPDVLETPEESGGGETPEETGGAGESPEQPMEPETPDGGGAVEGPEPSEEANTPPEGSEETPGEGEAPPEGSGETPGEGEAPPEGSGETPGEGEAPPEGSEETPGESETPPEAQTPSGSSEAPETPPETDEPPATSEGSPGGPSEALGTLTGEETQGTDFLEGPEAD